jgi:hypothetical protein
VTDLRLLLGIGVALFVVSVACCVLYRLHRRQIQAGAAATMASKESIVAGAREEARAEVRLAVETLKLASPQAHTPAVSSPEHLGPALDDIAQQLQSLRVESRLRGQTFMMTPSRTPTLAPSASSVPTFMCPSMTPTMAMSSQSRKSDQDADAPLEPVVRLEPDRSPPYIVPPFYADPETIRFGSHDEAHAMRSAMQAAVGHGPASRWERAAHLVETHVAPPAAVARRGELNFVPRAPEQSSIAPKPWPMPPLQPAAPEAALGGTPGNASLGTPSGAPGDVSESTPPAQPPLLDYVTPRLEVTDEGAHVGNTSALLDNVNAYDESTFFV